MHVGLPGTECTVPLTSITCLVSVSHGCCPLPMCLSVCIPQMLSIGYAHCPPVSVSVSHRCCPLPTCLSVSVVHVITIAHLSFGWWLLPTCLTGDAHRPQVSVSICVLQILPIAHVLQCLPMCHGVCVPQVPPMCHGVCPTGAAHCPCISVSVSHRCCPLPMCLCSTGTAHVSGCLCPTGAAHSPCVSVSVSQVLPIVHVFHCLCPMGVVYCPCVSVSVSHRCCPLPMCLSVCLCPAGAAHCPLVSVSVCVPQFLPIAHVSQCLFVSHR